MKIPGYYLEDLIGEGSRGYIYRGVELESERRVAVKVFSKVHLRSKELQADFETYSRAISVFNHPNIVKIFNYGVLDGIGYHIMEYISGGDLHEQLKAGLHSREVIEVIKDVANALDYVHSRNVFHGDVKPENILFRSRGSIVLADFHMDGIVNSTAGAEGYVIGTPEYMSPEQISGKAVGSPSDLYSLGIVFYEMLTGLVPYRGDNAKAIGRRHLQDPIPELPESASMFQGTMEKILAKKPKDRFGSGRELARELDSIRSDGYLPNTVVRTDRIHTQEIEAIVPPLGEHNRPDSKNTVAIKRSRARRNVTFASFLVLVLLGGYLIADKPPMFDKVVAWTGWQDDEKIEELWMSAEALRSDPNQSLNAVVVAYRKVLEIDAEHSDAKRAIEEAASQWKLDIGAALDTKNFSLAEIKLNELFSMFESDDELSELFNLMDSRRRANVLLEDARLLVEREGRRDDNGAMAAIQAFHEVIRLHPENFEAAEQLDELAAYYASRASESVGNGDLSVAMNLLARAVTANPEFFLLGEVREEIRQATSLQAEIESMLQDASGLRVKGSLIEPPTLNAAEIYHRVLATDPDNTIARQGLAEVGMQILNIFNERLISQEFTAIDQLLERSIAVGLGDNHVSEMKSRYETEVLRLKQIKELLAEAQILFDNGFITEPVDINAITVLRKVLVFDPGNQKAKERLMESATLLASVAREAHAVGLMTEAGHYLELALTVAPDVEEWRNLRESWGVAGN